MKCHRDTGHPNVTWGEMEKDFRKERKRFNPTWKKLLGSSVRWRMKLRAEPPLKVIVLPFPWETSTES